MRLGRTELDDDAAQREQVRDQRPRAAGPDD